MRWLFSAVLVLPFLAAGASSAQEAKPRLLILPFESGEPASLGENIANRFRKKAERAESVVTIETFDVLEAVKEAGLTPAFSKDQDKMIQFATERLGADLLLLGKVLSVFNYIANGAGNG